ncbi:MAG: penicillin-binding protein 2 [Chloroflexi bacterium]|nr:penicillin-binding protein 2 [Chloroflexota bacterium]
MLPQARHRRHLKPRAIILPALLFFTISCQPSPTTDTQRPSPMILAQTFLSAWESGDYPTMYSLLATASQERITAEDFGSRYSQELTTATVTGTSIQIVSSQSNADQANVQFTITLTTILLDEYQVSNALPLVWEDGWRVDWSPALIYPGLDWDTHLQLERLRPSRASIYARDGQPLAIDGIVITVGVIPGEIQDEPRLLTELSRILEMPPDEIQEIYRSPGVQPHWFVPIGDISFEKSVQEQEVLLSLAGVQLGEKPVRTYPQGPRAAHLVGYLGAIDQEELATYTSLGYEAEDLVGKAGLERWGEEYLAGGFGGRLSIVNSQGVVVEVVRENPAQPSLSLYTTIDLRVQQAAEEALGERRGAVVALDPRTGEILAMASYPRFDPNQLITGVNLQEIFTDPASPLLNRATQGALPTGSVFKIITTAAALEGAGVDTSITVFCPGYWLAPWGRRYNDWRAHGTVDFRQAIIQSSNTFFYEMGLRLNSIDPWLLPTWAKNFGLGQATGILGLPTEAEDLGLVPDPDWKECCFTGEGNPFWVPGDAVNLAVGQGDLKVTPLQAANFIAAIANGGTLYRPRLATSAGEVLGRGSIDFPAEIIGTLNLSEKNLQFMQEALQGVTIPPLGTARSALQGLLFTAAGKTGTAESVPGQLPHAWFVGYAPADDPQIAVAVMLENVGEGAFFAVPVFRTVAEAYLLPPDQRTPTPEPTSIPSATPTP